MRHGKKFNHLGRKKAHREAMLSNMACSLIEHKRVNTTVAKAKALKRFVEPLITKSKTDTTHSRRVVFSYLRQKEAVTELFREVSAKVADRPGGYTRIIRIGNRLGDNAEMCMIELVDFNDVYTTEKKVKKKRSRRGKKGSGTAAAAATAAVAGAAATVADKASDVAESAVEGAEGAVEAAADLAENTVDKAKDVASDASDASSNATEAVSEKAEEVVDKAKDAVTGEDDAKSGDEEE